MMEHPLIGNLDELTIEQLSEKINDLHRKLTVAHRSGNGYLCDQIRMAIESYSNKLRQRQQEQYEAAQQSFDDKIKIS
jgi:hypothetical protein